MKLVKFVALLSIITINIAFANDFGSVKTFNSGEIYYEKAIKEEMVDKLGKYLIDTYFFDGTPRSVQLRDEGISYTLKFIVSDSLLTDKTYLKQVRYFTYQLSDYVFDNTPVDIHLASTYFITKKVVKFLRLGNKIEVGNDDIFYLPEISREKADAFINYLKGAGFLTGDGKAILIETVEEIFNFKYPIDAGYENNAEYIDIVKQFADQISKEFLDNGNIVIYLTDIYFDELRAISNF